MQKYNGPISPRRQAGMVLRQRKDSFLDQFSPESNAMVEIDLQYANGGATLRCKTHQHRSIPPKMPRPFMTAGLNSGTIFLFLGSMPAMFSPLWRLHAKHHKQRLLAIVGPS
jgi:hypothetical protein